MHLTTLLAKGFDGSTKKGKTLSIKCSQCQATFINGVAYHETGCPNQMFECKGCNTMLSYRGYCPDCSN